MTSHYLCFTPLRVVSGCLVQIDGTVEPLYTALDCWLDRTLTAVAMDCACGYRVRLLTETDLGIPLRVFYGEPSDEVLSTLMAELDSSMHALDMVPALRDLEYLVRQVPMAV